jgi:hypothetical protein
MNAEYFKYCISIIESIDTYIREIDTSNIDDYEDFYPFIDEDDILLYKDVDKEVLINYTVGIFLKSKIDSKKKSDIFFTIAASYMLSIKYITDCNVYKGYNFIIDFLTEFSDLIGISELNIDNKKILKKLINLEWNILNKINFFASPTNTISKSLTNIE